MTPLKRFYNLLKLEKRDVYQIIFYAAFAGLVLVSSNSFEYLFHLNILSKKLQILVS